jgi:hypothetical protein
VAAAPVQYFLSAELARGRRRFVKNRIRDDHGQRRIEQVVQARFAAASEISGAASVTMMLTSSVTTEPRLQDGRRQGQAAILRRALRRREKSKIALGKFNDQIGVVVQTDAVHRRPGAKPAFGIVTQGLQLSRVESSHKAS